MAAPRTRPRRDTADSRRRAVAYIRESTEEQGQGFSPDAQREGIRRFAPENNLELIGEYCDFHSGWRKSDARPEFQRLMADAAAGAFDVVLVFHTSRFARNQVEARRYKQLLRERLGIRVISITQPMGDDPSDPSTFLAESIHEMFDEYYSVSLSFWTRSGLKEKARQGHLVGSLPWGYVRDPATKLAVPDPARAPLVLEMFERYAAGQESDRTLAAWLNAKGALSARGRQFGKDTIRDMLCNAAYAGYVTGLRDQSRAIKGLHEAIVPETLFDRVQEIRAYRATVKQPSPPSDEYLLRMLLRCERCGARMHGTRGSRPPVRRYLCATRRHGEGCTQTITKAEPLESQLVDWLRGFQPDAHLRNLVLDAIIERSRRTRRPRRTPLRTDRAATPPARPLRPRRPHKGPIRHAPPGPARRDRAPRPARRPAARPSGAAPVGLRRVLGGRDLARRAPPPAHHALRADLAKDNGTIVAVKPRGAFVPYFQAATQTRPKPIWKQRCPERERRDSNPRPLP